MLDQPSLPGAGQVLLVVLVGVAAIFDIRSRRIPNWLVLAGLVGGILWNVYAGGLSGLTRAGAGLAIGFVLYFPLYLLRARGAGDVKLLAAIGAITGPGNCVWIFLFTAIGGGVIALAWVLIRGEGRRIWFNVGWILRDLAHFKAPHRSSAELDVRSASAMRLPHAAMLAVGVLIFLLKAR
jgi:prepilin peptidase CpaA